MITLNMILLEHITEDVYIEHDSYKVIYPDDVGAITEDEGCDWSRTCNGAHTLSISCTKSVIS